MPVGLHALLFIGLLAGSSGAQAVGTSGADVLRLKVDARAWALGLGGTAAIDSVGCPLFNPAALGTQRRPAADFQHFFAFPDLAVEQLSIRHYWRPLGTLAGLLLYRHPPPIDNVSGAPPFYVSDTVLGLYLGRAAGELGWLGAGLKMAITRLGDEYAYAFAADLGGLHRLRRLFDLSIVLRNAGVGTAFQQVTDPLPWEIGCGIARAFFFSGGERFISPSLDLDIQREGGAAVGLGLEGGWRHGLTLRAGCHRERGYSLSNGPSLGAGLYKDFKLFQVQADYCWKLLGFKLGGYDSEHLLGFTFLVGPVAGAAAAKSGAVGTGPPATSAPDTK